MEMNVPALLFPAISLLLLAYTNRYLGLSSVIRNLYKDYQTSPDPKIIRQIANLRRRVVLIRRMQGVGVGSLFLCVLCMFLIYFGLSAIAHAVFGLSLIALLFSLGLSIAEIGKSSEAMNILLSDLEHDLAKHDGA